MNLFLQSFAGGEIKTPCGKINTLNGEINSEINTVYGEIKHIKGCYTNTKREVK